jgi:hypothetical protein
MRSRRASHGSARPLNFGVSRKRDAVQGPIAQIVALTTYGNAFLTGARGADLSEFFPTNSTFIFCEHVRFVDLHPKVGKLSEVPYAADPPTWLSQLKRDNTHGLRMVYRPTDEQQLRERKVTDRMLVGFVGGGGRWLIEAIGDRGSDYWEGRWEVGDQERKDQRIWRVTYGRIATSQPFADLPTIDLITLSHELAANLKAIAKFARKHDLNGFADAFDAGLAQLSSDAPLASVYHKDLAPHHAVTLPAARLLGAAQAAWVFGGMGSWNDLGFEGDDQALYERLSEGLYRLLNGAIVAGANAGAPPLSGPEGKARWKLWS